MQIYFNDLKDILKNSKLYLIFCILSFVAGIVLSFFCHKFEGLLFYINVLERYMFIFDNSMHVSSYFLSKIFAMLGSCIIFFICGTSIYLIPIHFVLFIYQGFVIGAICPYFYKIYYISGIIVYVLALLPSMILRFLSITFYSTICVKTLKNKNCNNSRFLSLLLLIFVVFMLHIIACLWEIIFIGIAIKPFNTFF